MSRRREFCLGEIDFFPESEFEVIDGVKIHKTQSRHRATDGIRVKNTGQKVEDVQDPPPPVFLTAP
jgi:hypothetical protein